MTRLEDELRWMLLADAWFVEILRAVRDCDPPGWAVGAGVIRNLVWDRLHGSTTRTTPRDVDVAYFDSTDLGRDRERAIEADLRARLPGVPWQVMNQAGVHLWYEAKFGYSISPIRSIEDAVSRWPETATSVAVRLLQDDRLLIFAPCGLDDLFSLVLRRNRKQVTEEYFRHRAATKAIMRRWPKVMIVQG